MYDDHDQLNKIKKKEKKKTPIVVGTGPSFYWDAWGNTKKEGEDGETR